MFGEIKADCRRCRRGSNPDSLAMLQRELGCHENAPAPVWRSACSCDGTTPDCSRCSGTGTVRHYRCPGSMIGKRRDVAEMATAWCQYEGRNVLPVEGGWLDQTAAFTDAVSLIDQERSHWERVKEKQLERERERARAQAASR